VAADMDSILPSGVNIATQRAISQVPPITVYFVNKAYTAKAILPLHYHTRHYGHDNDRPVNSTCQQKSQGIIQKNSNTNQSRIETLRHKKVHHPTHQIKPHIELN